MNFTPLTALSALDGRYANKVAVLRAVLSEFGYMRERVRVELHWFEALSSMGFTELPGLSDIAKATLKDLRDGFNESHAERIKAIERTTNHDVKAVEYWIKEQFEALPELKAKAEFVHFACTSEDINNTSHALQLKTSRDEILLPALGGLIKTLQGMAHTHAALPMLSRTHGQTASPSTVGKEIANVALRLQRAADRIAAVRIMGKMNGAVGNYGAHLSAWPQANWPEFARGVVEDRLGLNFQTHSTQIEPHDYMAELFDAYAHANVILIDFARDMWGYISVGYFKQRAIAGEVGSSTMPHKVNPIDFENAEGNLGVANALLRHFSDKLPISRWQRDLSDSTVLRNMGTALGHCLLAYRSLATGLGKVAVNPQALAADLDAAWEVLAEPVQTVMRRYGLPQPYEQLKAFTRGEPITQERMHAFIAQLDIPTDAKSALLALTPGSYTGMAAELAKQV
jgi:adenylosuccinate lyase